MEQEPLLRVEELKIHFQVDNPDSNSFWSQKIPLKAVDGVSFHVHKGETLGLVGESGCGKSTTARGIVQLYRPTSGSVVFEGKDLAQLPENQLTKYRAKLQMVFQDPYASLNPRMTVGDIISEPARIFKTYKSDSELRNAVSTLMEKVGLQKRFINRYPHAFSGGQRQRIGIARALISSPEIIIADEPVSALDVSIQAQVLNLFQDLQKEYGLTYIFIAHDLSVVKHMCTRIAVMYLGRIVEIAPTKSLFALPRHPYTEALISAVNVPDPEVEKTRKRIILKGEIPSPLNPPKGCPFHTRCPKAKERCSEEVPKLEKQGDHHHVACFFPND